MKRIFLNTDLGCIELPNHATALANIEYTNPRLIAYVDLEQYRDHLLQRSANQRGLE